MDTVSLSHSTSLNDTPNSANGSSSSESSHLLTLSDSSSAVEIGRPASPASYKRTSTWTSSTGSTQPTKRRNLFKSWAWECLLVVSAVGMLIALISLILSFEGLPQPSWALGINLNTLAALIATLLRSSLVMVVEEVISQAKWIWQRRPKPVRDFVHFDNASRGPWGSFMLMFRIPKLYALSSLVSRNSSSTILACFVAILSLAIGSFTQQAIKPRTCSVAVPGINASLPVTDRVADVISNRWGAGLWDIDISLKGSIINALARSSTVPDSLLNNCTTGNCTFPESNGITHRTIGFCSKCIETTKFLELHGYNDSRQIPEIGWGRLPNGMEVGPLFGPDYNVGLIQLKASQIWSNGSEQSMDWASSVMDDEIRELINKNATAFTLDILSTTTVGCKLKKLLPCEPQFKGNNGTIPTQWNVVGASCHLYPCLKEMWAESKDGILTEKIMRTTPMTRLKNQDMIPHTLLDVPCTVDGVRYDIHNISLANITESESAQETSQKNITKWYHSEILVNGQLLFLPYQCAFESYYRLARGLQLFWDEIAEGGCNSPNNMDSWSAREFPRCSSWWHGGLYNKGNATFESISERLEAVAVAITNSMRLDTSNIIDLSNPDNIIYGTVWQSTVCTSFDWPWLLFPAILVFLTAASLILIIWVTALDDEGAPVWKSSILPLLYCRDLGSMHEIKRTSEKATAVLEKVNGDGKWQIVLKESLIYRDSDASPYVGTWERIVARCM